MTKIPNRVQSERFFFSHMSFRVLFFIAVPVLCAGFLNGVHAETATSNPTTFRPEIDLMRTLDIRTIENVDAKLCTGTGVAMNEYLCDSASAPKLSNPKLDAAEKRLEQTHVNRSNQASVNTYNSIVADYNQLALSQNETIKEQCLPIKEYCEPVFCQTKIRNSAWQKSADQCVCSEGTKLKDGKCVRDSWIIDLLLYAFLLFLGLLSLKKTFSTEY